MANRISRGIFWTTLGTVSRNVVGLLQVAILTRFLLKEEFGIIAIANIFLTFTNLFLDMGMAEGVMYKQDISKREYSSIFWLNIFFGVILTLMLFVLSPYLTKSYSSDDLTNIVRLICFTIFLNSLGTLSRTYSIKNTFFKRLSVIDILGSVITCFVAFITAYKGYGAYSLAYSTLAGSIFINTVYLYYISAVDRIISFHFSFKETYSYLKIGIYKVGSSVLDFFSRELDILIISATLGLEFVGVYNIAKKIPTAMYSFVSPIVYRVFTPFFAEMNSNVLSIKSSYIKLSKALSWVSFPMYFFLAAISSTIIVVVFGKEYLDGVPVMMIFCLKYAFNGVNGVCGSLQTALGRTDIGLKWTIYLIFSTLIVYWVTSLYGITIFLIGICVMIFVNIIALWILQFKPMVKISLAEYLSIYSRAFIICAALAIIVYTIHPSASISYSIFSFLCFVPLYLLLLLRTEDGKQIYNLAINYNINSKILKFIRRSARINKL